jgi:tetratricopeptide (TPR) repeat protein
MGISERLPVNHRNMPSLAGMRYANRYSHNSVAHKLEDIGWLTIPQLMSRAHICNDDPRTLDIAIKYYGEVLKREPRNQKAVEIMMAVASKKYFNDLESRLKIYVPILENSPDHKPAIHLMRALAHHKYENDLESQLKIYGTILKYGSKSESEGAQAIMMSLAHYKYGNNLDKMLQIYGAILECKPDDERTKKVMGSIAHHQYEDDLESRLKIYDVILACDPVNEHTIHIMMHLAGNKYHYNSKGFIAIMNMLEKYHPIDDLSFSMSGLKGKQTVLKMLFLERNYMEIVRLTENVSEPELLKLRSEALSKLA